MFKTQAEFNRKVETYIDYMGENELHSYLNDYLWESGEGLLDVITDSRFINYLCNEVKNRILASEGLTYDDIENLPEEE